MGAFLLHMAVKNGTNCCGNGTACGTECHKIMGSHKSLCPLVHFFQIQRTIYKCAVKPLLRIFIRTLINMILVSFFDTVITRMEIPRHFPCRCHHNIFRQKGANRQRNFFRRNGSFYINDCPLSQSVNASVCAAGTDTFQFRIAKKRPQGFFPLLPPPSALPVISVSATRCNGCPSYAIVNKILMGFVSPFSFSNTMPKAQPQPSCHNSRLPAAKALWPGPHQCGSKRHPAHNTG